MFNSGSRNFSRFMSSATAASTPSPLSNVQTPASFTTIRYGGHYLQGAPDAENDQDANDPEMRREFAARALFSIVTLILHTTPSFTQQTRLGTSDWEKWFSLVITLAHLILDTPIADQGISAGTTAITGTDINDLYLAFVRFLRSSDTDEYLVDLTACAAKLGMPSFSTAPSAQHSDLSKSGVPTERWALYSIVIYVMGRPPSGGKVTGITKRMKNLADKGNRGALWSAVGGNLKPTDGAFTILGLLWEKDGRFRAAMFRPLMGYARKLGDMNETMMSTILGLLPMSQMAHVRILMDFLTTFEFVAQMPELQAEMAILASSAETWATFPPLERPYAKMLWRDQFKAFDSKQLVRLVKLATDKLSASGGPTGGYALRGADQALSDAFDARLVTWLAQNAGVASPSAAAAAGPPASGGGAPALP